MLIKFVLKKIKICPGLCSYEKNTIFYYIDTAHYI